MGARKSKVEAKEAYIDILRLRKGFAAISNRLLVFKDPLGFSQCSAGIDGSFDSPQR